MNEGEFKIQLLETKAQWESGLPQRLNLGAEGVSLLAQPSFDSWLVVHDWPDKIGDIVVDECCQIYWTAFESARRAKPGQRTWRLFRYNPVSGQIELLLDFGSCGILEPQKMWLRGNYLWILDLSEKRALALSRENFQIVHEISLKGEQIELETDDVDLDHRGVFYALIKQSGKEIICRYPTTPGAQSDRFTLEKWKQPVALAIDRQGILFVLDSGLGRFIRYDPVRGGQKFLGALAERLLKNIKPSLMEIDENGMIYLASDAIGAEPARLHLFDQDGSYLGEIKRNKCGEVDSWDGIPLPEHCGHPVKKIGGIGFDCRGGVYLATDLGLAKFSLNHTPAGQDGVYYSKTLDNGVHEGLWHRIALRGLLPDKTSAEVYYFTSDDAALRKAYERVLSEDKSVEERVAGIENLMQPRWKGPEIFKGTPSTAEAAPDMLPLDNKGRYLWLKLRLLTFDASNRPAIRSARVYYQRMSYLRYIPPAYREDVVSAAFLERFLSLFETVFHGLDLEIDQLDRFFNPMLTPPGFLPWLASWINLSVDDDLPVDRMRRLIRRAPDLYGRKGTPAALQEFLEIYTGQRVSLSEHSRGLKPMVLGSPDFRLGKGTILLGSGVKSFRLGDTSVVGYSALRDREPDPDEPFLPALRRFTISIDMPRDEFNRRAGALRRILDEHKPAHTACAIRLIIDQNAAGTAILGAGAAVTGMRPYQVGVTPLGSGFAIAKTPEILRLERGAWIGSSLRI